MPKHKPLYLYSLQQAIRSGDKDLWRESYRENCSCARAVEKAIDDGYADNRLDTSAAKGILSEFGQCRVQWVLANTIQCHHEDGRFSPDNKDWANHFCIPRDEGRWQYSVNRHPGLVNLFADRIKTECQAISLNDAAAERSREVFSRRELDNDIGITMKGI